MIGQIPISLSPRSVPSNCLDRTKLYVELVRTICSRAEANVSLETIRRALSVCRSSGQTRDLDRFRVVSWDEYELAYLAGAVPWFSFSHVFLLNPILLYSIKGSIAASISSESYDGLR